MRSAYIVAEVGPNHNGKADLAKEVVHSLSKTGVDAIKFQMSIPEKTLSLDAIKASYQEGNDNAEDIVEASRKRQLSRKEHRELAVLCSELGVDYLCTAFDLESLKFLDQVINVPKFKVASGEIFSLDLLEYMRDQDKPIIFSTGMATYEEISKSLDVLDPDRTAELTILHCVSNYPTPLEDVNLRCMSELRRRFEYPVGFSDHTLGNVAPTAAVARGASVIEKHVTPDKSLPGPDHQASATVDQFDSLVSDIRNVERCLGTTQKQFSEEEQEIAQVARKSIVAKSDLEPGDVITKNDICFRRPGTGFLPIEEEKVLGARASNRIEANRVIQQEDIEWN
ncbi:N-acetylneuraminate synthase family protein [Salinibacter ruber]|uniref:N-acetylneuraminate synthase family protein n=1 Tax=Salinibacter ruber TaxID=146919 RepID=UPI00216A79B5|nr:N-acetylneuraminate synthase family protein [Salinibacter ruber]